MSSLTGSAPNQVPTNGDLGTMAFQDSSSVMITGGIVATNYQYAVPVAAGTSIMLLSSPELVLEPAATIASYTVYFPYNPIDGLKISISSTAVITTLTLGANNASYTIKNPVTTLAAGTAIGYIFVQSKAAWYRTN